MNDKCLKNRFVCCARSLHGRRMPAKAQGMPPQGFRERRAGGQPHTLTGLALMGLLLPWGFSCDTSLLSSLNLGGLILPSTLTVRVENATNSFANVTVTTGLSETASSSESSSDSSASTSFVVRVSPASLSLGSLTCAGTLSGSTGFKVAATVGGDTTKTVLLSGHGTGTPGFDDGSIGSNGERYLIRGTHYTCGDTIVVRITSDGSGSSTGSGSTALGEIERYAEGETVPTRSLSPETIDGDGSTDIQDTESDVSVRIANQTAYFMKVNVAAAASSVGEDVTIYVPPGFTTNGDVACESQFKLTVSTVDGTKLAHVVLTGDGTGVAGFDNGSIGPIGDRTLIRGDHFSCGDRVTITITNAGSPDSDIDEAIVGAGTVAVTAGS